MSSARKRSAFVRGMLSVRTRWAAVWLAVLFAGLLAVLAMASREPQQTAPAPQDAAALAPAAPAAPNEAWLAQVQRTIERSEYNVTWQTDTAVEGLTGAWQAPNRAHGFRTYFTGDGIRVVPRTDEQPSWEWGLSLVGYGRDCEVWSVALAAPAVSANRVERAGGGLTEWYINDRHGLKQGFALTGPPERNATDSPIAAARSADGAALLVLEMTGDLRPVLSADGQAIDLVGASSSLAVARFGALTVRDATDRELPAWMEIVRGADGTHLHIVFDDRDAAYPVTVDPLLQTEAWSKEGNQSSSQFGRSVASAGNVNGDHICRGGPDDGLLCSATVACSGGACMDLDDVIIGAPYFDAGEADEGRVFVFHGSPSGLETYPAWTAESNQASAYFGISVDGAGDVNNDGFDDVVVGADRYDGGATDEGRVFVYHGSASGLGASPAWFRDGDNQAGAYFGHAVAGDGDISADGFDDVVIGAYSYDGAPGAAAGRAYVYYGSTTGLSDSHWYREGPQAWQFFGISVAGGDFDGDHTGDVIVGSEGWDYDADNTDNGRAYVYYGPMDASGADWYQYAGQSGAHFGCSVASAGDTNGDGIDDVIIGARDYNGTYTDGGRAYVYLGSPTGLLANYCWVFGGDETSEYLGYSVAGAGDTNGDGTDDVIVGSSGWNGGGTDRGRALVFLGDPDWDSTAFAPTRSWNKTGETDYAYYGAAVAGAGDVNGDGYDDVIVGSYNFTGDKSGEGKAYVYHGAQDARAADLVVHALERQDMVCVGGAGAGSLCDEDADCAGGACTGQVDFDGTGVVVYDNAATAPSPYSTPQNNDTIAAAYYGSLTHSVVLSTGLAQDGGRGDTDWGRDGDPDVVRWQFRVNPPAGAKTFRFTTQFITSDISAGKSRDSISLHLERKVGEPAKTLNLMGVAGLSIQDTNAPVSHGIRVDDVPGADKIRLIFEVKDGVDGAKDSALVVSNLTFSELSLPEGADFNSDYLPELLSNPSPQDTGAIAGAYSYEKTLISIPGIRMPFEFAIRYRSNSNQTSPSLGMKWSHSFESTLQKAKIQVDRDNDGSVDDPEDIVVVRLPSGASEYFKCPQADGLCNTVNDTYSPKYASVYSTLKQTALASSGGSFEYETKQHVKYAFNVDLNVPDGATGDEYEKYALNTITDANGNVITLSYDASKRLDYVLDTRGAVFTFNYDSAGWLLSVEDSQAGGGSVSFQHVDHFVDGVAQKLLGSFTDLNGYVTSFSYDRMGNILSATDDDGTVFASNDFEKYAIGLGLEQIGCRTTAQRNANPGDAGMLFTFTSDAVRSDDRVAGLEKVRYDVKSREHDRRTFLGTLDTGSTCAEADEPCWAETVTERRGVCIGDPANTECRSDADCAGGRVCGSTAEPMLLTDPLGTRTALRYDRCGNETASVEAHWQWNSPDIALCVGGPQQGVQCDGDADCPDSHCGARTEFTYDASSNLLARLPHGWAWADCGLAPPHHAPCYAYTYDAKHNLLTETNEAGYTITYTYNTDLDSDGTKEGLRDTRTDRRSFVTSFQYDARGYLTQETGPSVDIDGTATAVVMRYDYDKFGRRIWTKDPRNNEFWFVYDTGGRKLSERNALNYTTSFSYDEWDRLLTKTHPDLMLETYEYTPTGRLKRSTIPRGAVVTNGECAGGTSDGAACTSDVECGVGGHCAVALKYGYDAEDRLVQKTDELGRTTAFTCDAGDRLVAVTDPASQAWTARYDAAGRLLGFTDPLNHETVYQYDLLGRLTSETDGSGNTVTSTYNPRGSITKITRARGETVTYSYNAADQLTGLALTGGRTITHTLDGNGNRTATIDVGGVGSITRTFDAYDRLKTRTDPFGHEIKYQYDPAGNLTKLTHSNNDTVSYTYDELNRLTGVTDWNGRTTTYGYDAAGNLTSITLPDASGTITYSYDAGRRLTGVTGPVYSGSFTRNASGAITSATETLPLEPNIDATPHTMIYDAANRLVSRDGVAFTYDADGNMTAGPIGGAARTLTYDALNELVQLDGDVYRYDADGLRVEVRPASGPWIRYIYDPTGKTLRVLEEYYSVDLGANWLLRARYVHGIGLISRVAADDSTKFYHYDLRGSTVALTAPGSANPTDLYAYDPYGKPVRQGATPNPFTYNGRDGVVDDGTGLYFMRTRYYAPELMRFIQKDQKFSGTLDDPQSLNRYAYVKGDPIRFVDPNGDEWTSRDWGKLLAVVGVVLLVVSAIALAVPTGGGSIVALVLFLAGVATTAGDVALLLKSEKQIAEQEQREARKAEAARAAAEAATMEDLRKQLYDPNAIWNRGLSAPLPRKASTDASDAPTPCQ